MGLKSHTTLPKRCDLGNEVKKTGITYRGTTVTTGEGTMKNEPRDSNGNNQNTDLSQSHHSATPGELHLLSSSQWLKTRLQVKVTDLSMLNNCHFSLSLSNWKNVSSGKKTCNRSDPIPQTKRAYKISNCTKLEKLCSVAALTPV